MRKQLPSTFSFALSRGFVLQYQQARRLPLSSRKIRDNIGIGQ